MEIPPASDAAPSGRGYFITGIEMEITDEEWGLILESLKYTKRSFENYIDYPSYEFKLKQIKEVDDLISKIRQMRKGVTWNTTK